MARVRSKRSGVGKRKENVARGLQQRRIGHLRNIGMIEFARPGQIVTKIGSRSEEAHRSTRSLCRECGLYSSRRSAHNQDIDILRNRDFTLRLDNALPHHALHNHACHGYSDNYRLHLCVPLG